jgi:hypothetical protein
VKALTWLRHILEFRLLCRMRLCDWLRGSLTTLESFILIIDDGRLRWGKDLGCSWEIDSLALRC